MQIPKNQIRFIVGTLHVYTPDDEVCAEIGRRVEGQPKWTPSLIRRATTYALQVHHEHQKLVRDFNLL
jgi:hypothetical protein